MQQLSRFWRRYKLFSLAVLALIGALVLQFTHQPTAGHWLLGMVAIIEVLPLLYSMLQDVRSGSYGIDVLAPTAIVVSVLLHQYWAAIVVALMLTGGELLEEYAGQRSKSELAALLKRAPQKAHLLRSRKTLDVKVNELKVGDKIIIQPGELVPVDAVMIEGTASFDEASLTGERALQQRAVGDKLLGGSINTDAIATAKVTATAEDSQYQQTVRLMRAASQSRAPFVRLANRYSIPFTIMAYAVALAVYVVSGQAVRFLEVIIVATPCPLLLAAPIALIGGMSRASRYGIIVRNGSALERLAEAKTIAFNKTGTLTKGQLRVANVIAYGSNKPQDILALAASIEQSSGHVLAQAIVSGAANQKLKLVKAKHVTEVAGRGVSAHLKGQEILIGRLSLLEESGVALPKQFKPSAVTQTAVYVAIDGQLAGIVLLEDEERADTVLTLERLQALGLKDYVMITGDNQTTAAALAKSLGIHNVHANMLPGDKLHVLESVKKRPLIFVGDGVKDAPALTASDVGIALGSRGSTAAGEAADVVIMANDLSHVATALSIARRTFKIARQSILVGIALSLILMAVFATGKFPPLAGAILQEVVDVVVIFYALRAHLARGEVA